MSFKIKWKNFWSNLFSTSDKSSTKRENNSRGVDSSKVKGSTGVQSTLDKLNGK